METIDLMTVFISLAGGLALFLFGMTMLGNSLEKLSSGRMEKILESLTNNIVKSVLLGAVVTAAVQSSGATTVIVIGLVNAGILKLSSAVGVIMGANIGTTITGQILRLGDLENNENVGVIMKLLTPSSLAPIFAVIGILLYMISKKENIKTLGEIFIGVGILFTGMLSMTESVSPLAELEQFREIFSSLTNPFLGVLAGAVVTVLLQSSSASVGILQAISTTGVLNFSAAFPIIMGQNIGTCSTPLISSVGANKNAKRAAMVHLYFNLIGTVLFLIVVYSYQAIRGFSFWDEPIDMGGIANFHTLFNVLVTAFFIPFHKVLEKLAVITVKEHSDSEEDEISENTSLDERFLKSPMLAIQQATNAIIQMGKMAQRNFRETRKLFSKYDEKAVDKIKEYEDIIDKTEDKVNAYLVTIADCELTETESRAVTMLLHLISEFERIGDYSINVMECAMELNSKGLVFSPEAMGEFTKLTDAVDEIIEMSINAVIYNDLETIKKIEPLEETIDQMQEILKSRHIERLKNSQCSIDKGIVFIDILTNLERISDHCSNIAIYILSNIIKKDNISRHEYIQRIHRGETEDYRLASEMYQQKYQI